MTSPEELDAARADERTARASVEEALARQRRYGLDAKGGSLDVKLAEADVEVAREDLVRAEAELATAFIRAPLEGTVLRLFAREGEALPADGLLEMGDVSTMVAHLEVYESDVQYLSRGQLVDLTSPAVPGDLSGAVGRIGVFVDAQTSVAALPAASTDARVVEVLVVLDAESSGRARDFTGLEVRGRFLR